MPRLTAAQAPAPAWTAPAWVASPAEVKKYFQLEYFKDKNALKSVNPGGDQVRQIKRIVQMFLSQLTQENNANLPKTVLDRFLADLHAQSVSPTARQIAMEETVALAPDILTNPDDLVRYNMISILSQLSVRQAQNSGGVETPSVPFNPAHRVLLNVVQDPQQFLGGRILAARGIMRICRDGENSPSSNEKSDIATVLVKTLEANPSSPSDGVWWFRLRLIEALGSVDRIDNTATQPIVIEALMDVITDQNEVWLNRSIAAQCITQLPYNSSTNVPLITSEIATLLVELSNEYNRAPTVPELKEAFKRIYLAFRPLQQRQAKEKKWGLLYEIERTGLSTHAPYVKGAWGVVVPIVRPFMESGVGVEAIAAVPAAQLQALTTWIQQNPPASRRLTPDGKEYPLRTTDPAAAVGDASK
ncbi:hypothetical protein SH661x_001593 [Planctomicrobium sp. SH661]|uniref:hypothetical protein n=1 Tax=Planctomicrobium sp. SH661 TaxID=3448124 RepID=UPI003F5C77D8